MSDFVSQLVALGSLLDSGKLTQEEFNRSKLSLVPGTPVESPVKQRLSLRRTSWSTVTAMCIISYLVIQTRFK